MVIEVPVIKMALKFLICCTCNSIVSFLSGMIILALDRFRLLLLAGALEINIKLHENKQVISFPPCPCVPSAKQTLEIVRSEGCYNLLVPVSFLAGEFLIGFLLTEVLFH